MFYTIKAQGTSTLVFNTDAADVAAQTFENLLDDPRYYDVEFIAE